MYKRHKYRTTISCRNAYQPQRFGSVILYTQEEFDVMSPEDKTKLHLITEEDITILDKFTWPDTLEDFDI